MNKKYESVITRVGTIRCENCGSVHCFFTYNDEKNIKEWKCDTCGNEWFTK